MTLSGISSLLKQQRMKVNTHTNGMNNLNQDKDTFYSLKNSYTNTVEPLTNDHPHLWSPAFYDRFFIDPSPTL